MLLKGRDEVWLGQVNHFKDVRNVSWSFRCLCHFDGHLFRHQFDTWVIIGNLVVRFHICWVCGVCGMIFCCLLNPNSWGLLDPSLMLSNEGPCLLNGNDFIGKGGITLISFKSPVLEMPQRDRSKLSNVARSTNRKKPVSKSQLQVMLPWLQMLSERPPLLMSDLPLEEINSSALPWPLQVQETKMSPAWRSRILWDIMSFEPHIFLYHFCCLILMIYWRDRSSSGCLVNSPSFGHNRQVIIPTGVLKNGPKTFCLNPWPGGKAQSHMPWGRCLDVQVRQTGWHSPLWNLPFCWFKPVGF